MHVATGGRINEPSLAPPPTTLHKSFVHFWKPGVRHSNKCRYRGKGKDGIVLTLELASNTVFGLLQLYAPTSGEG